jgi:hypothetical protein
LASMTRIRGAVACSRPGGDQAGPDRAGGIIGDQHRVLGGERLGQVVGQAPGGAAPNRRLVALVQADQQLAVGQHPSLQQRTPAGLDDQPGGVHARGVQACPQPGAGRQLTPVLGRLGAVRSLPIRRGGRMLASAPDDDTQGALRLARFAIPAGAADDPSRHRRQTSRRHDRLLLVAGSRRSVILFSPGGIVSGHSGSIAGTGRLIAVGIAAVSGIVLAGTAAQLIGYRLFHGRVPALNSASDGGLFGLVGDISIATATVAAWIVLIRVRPVRVAMVVLPPLLTFLTVDKIFRLHDHIPDWLAFYLPVLAATFVAVAAAARGLSPRCFRLTAIGLALLIGSFILHQYGEWLLYHLGGSSTGWMYQVKAVVKHGLEVAGWFVIALGLAIGLREHDSLRVSV